MYQYKELHTTKSLNSAVPDLAHFLEALLQTNGLLLMGGYSVDLLRQRVYHLGGGF